MNFIRSLKLSSLSLCCLLFSSYGVAMEQSSLQIVVDNANKKAARIDQAREHRPKYVSPMAYDPIRAEIVAEIQNKKPWQIRRDNCCYNCLILPAAVVSAFTFDSNHDVINGVSRFFYSRTVGYAGDVLAEKKKN